MSTGNTNSNGGSRSTSMNENGLQQLSKYDKYR